MKENEKISQPSKAFDKPKDILSESSLDDKQKMKALLNWKQICIQVQDSSAEGMEGVELAEELRLVSNAINELSEKTK